MVDRADNYSKTGDIVIFGKYPVRREKNENIISELNNCVRRLPTKEDPKYWHTYEYYIERERKDFMYYVDIGGPFRGEYYRGVYFTEHRPITTEKTEKKHIPTQKENGYEPNKIYWFKLEDLCWNVVMEDDEVAYLVADRILDAQPFYTPKEGEDRIINGVKICQNNYAYSDIRRWLNKDFLEYAFTEEQIERIVKTKADNSDDGNRFVCEDTEDKIFLLSQNEAQTLFSNNAARKRITTDYARCQGALTGTEGIKTIEKCGKWWLRTPDKFASNFSCCVGQTGSCVFSTEFDCYTYTGVVPAMMLSLRA